MAWAALGKSLLKGGLKKVATKKLLNRKKKPKVGKVKAEKLMGGDNKGKGGAIVKSGSSSIVPVSSPITSITKAETQTKSGSLMVIKEKVLQIDKLLKGTLAAEKAERKKQILEEEKSERKKDEQEIEGAPPTKDKKFKIPVPKKITSFWDEITRYFSTILFGWLAVRLIDWLPKLIPLVKAFGSVVDFVMDFGGVILNALVSFVDKGYEAFEWTEEKIGDVFGDDGAKKFKNFSETFNKFLNVALIAALVAAKAGLFGGGGPRAPRGPRRGPRNRLRRTRTRIRRFTKPNTKALERAKRLKEIAKKRKAAEAALRRARLLRKLRPTNLRRVARVATGKPIRAVSNIIKSPAVKNAVQSTQTAIRNAPQTLKTIKQVGGEKVDDVVKVARNIVDNAPETLKNIKQSGAEKIDDVAKTGKNWFGKVKGFGKNLWGKAGQAYNFLGKQGQKFMNWADDFGKKFMANIDEIVQGISAKASKWATQIGDIAEMAKNPAKLVEKVKGVLSGQLDDILKQNKTIAQLRNLDPKKASGAIKGLLDNAKKSKGLMQVRNALKGAQKMKIGGVDKVIAAVMGLLDYTLLGESPINAILRALGGLLGYSAGFAIGAPFGGVPGFITGMAGAFVGEQASRLISKVLAKSPLGQIQDPIMNDGRMLVRDPDDQGMNEQLEQDQKEIAEERGDSDKIDKIFKIGKKEYDLSKVMGGLSREEYDALSTTDRKRLNRRMTIWKGQNKEEWHANIKGNANNIVPIDVDAVSKKTDNISNFASYEESSDQEIVVVAPSSNSNQNQNQNEEGSVLPVVVGGGGGDDPYSNLYESG